MSSIFFNFHYDDGSNRPFDPDAASESDASKYEVAVVSSDGMIDLFDASAEDVKKLGLTDAAFSPSFILDFDESAEDKGLGLYENEWWDMMTIPVEPSDLKVWAEKWILVLQGMSDAQRKEILINHAYGDQMIVDLRKLALQADCAIAHGVKIMLFVAW